MYLRIKLLCILTFVPTSAFSAQINELRVALVDAVTNEPLSYATIRIEGTDKGLIADYSGEFRLPIYFKTQAANLVITSIGYETLIYSVSQLDENILNTIRVKAQVEVLGEVVIEIKDGNNGKKRKTVGEVEKDARALTAYQIVQKAIEKIPENLSQEPFAFISYYRDYQIVNDLYHNLNEGILETFDAGITSNKLLNVNNKSLFYNFRRNQNFIQDSALLQAYNGETKYIQNASIEPRGGNELTILNIHNPIRSYDKPSFSYVYTLKQDFLVNHEVKREKVFYLDNEPIVRILFSNISKLTSYIFTVEGELYISLKDFSIHRFNYTCFDYDRINPFFNINIEYRKQGQYMYPNYITFNNRFVISDRDFFKEDEVIFDGRTFRITFNTPIDVESLSVNRFKVYYDNKRLLVKDVTLISDRLIEVTIDIPDGSFPTMSELDASKLEIKMKRIKDIYEREIYKPTKLIGFQFRELFVQEVTPGKAPIDDHLFIDKNEPLLMAPVNLNLESNDYWINSPLRQSKAVMD